LFLPRFSSSGAGPGSVAVASLLLFANNSCNVHQLKEDVLMALKDDFEKAQADVKTLKEKPDNATLLELYALYKQGTEGDAAGRRPGIMDPVGRAKFDAWAAKKGASNDDAMTAYIAYVKKLLG
jgi:diazepam-binding inhibitor (GABA receptor modulator, acyl-CoA-binding protein)